MSSIIHALLELLLGTKMVPPGPRLLNRGRDLRLNVGSRPADLRSRAAVAGRQKDVIAIDASLLPGAAAAECDYDAYRV